MRKSTSTSVFVFAAVALMAGLVVWMLTQMAPDGPKGGAYLVWIAVGAGIALVVAVPLVIAPLRRRHSARQR